MHKTQEKMSDICIAFQRLYLCVWESISNSVGVHARSLKLWYKDAREFIYNLQPGCIMTFWCSFLLIDWLIETNCRQIKSLREEAALQSGGTTADTSVSPNWWQQGEQAVAGVAIVF